MSRFIERVIAGDKEGFGLILMQDDLEEYQFLLIDLVAIKEYLNISKDVSYEELFFYNAISMLEVEITTDRYGRCIPTTYNTALAGRSPYFKGKGWGRIPYMAMLAILYGNSMGFTSDRGSTKWAAGKVYMALEAEGLVKDRTTSEGNTLFDYEDRTADPDDDCEEGVFEQDVYYDHKKSSILREEAYNQIRDPIQSMLDRGAEFMRYLREDKNLDPQYLGILFYDTAETLFRSAYDQEDMDWERFLRALQYSNETDRFSSGTLFPNIILKSKKEAT
jgi:hypothetical protein